MLCDHILDWDLKMTKLYRTYSELMRIPSYDDRFDYAKLYGKVGELTFGSKRWLNQIFYHSDEWKTFRRKIIIRDDGCDLAMPGYKLNTRIHIHHLTPITDQDILDRRLDLLLNENNVVCVSLNTHNAIHYSDKKLLPRVLNERLPNDTCPWK